MTRTFKRISGTGAVALTACLALGGCGLLILQTSTPLEAGKANTARPPYIVATLQLSPPVAQRFWGGGITIIDTAKFPLEDSMGFLVTPDLQRIPWENAGFVQALGSAFFGYNPFGGDNVYLRTKGLSVVPTPYGVRYFRWGSYFVSSRCTVRAVNSGCRVSEEEYVNSYRDIKVTIPPGARAVYIGNIVMFHRDGLVQKISVTNDFARMAPALQAMNVPGLKPGDVTVRLAQVLGSSSK